MRRRLRRLLYSLAAKLLVYEREEWDILLFAFAAYIKKNRSRPPSKLGAGSVLSDVRGSL